MLQSPTPTETSWYLVRLNKSSPFSQDRLFSQGSHSLYALFSHSRIQVWGQIRRGKYGFEHEDSHDLRGVLHQTTHVTLSQVVGNPNISTGRFTDSLSATARGPARPTHCVQNSFSRRLLRIVPALDASHPLPRCQMPTQEVRNIVAFGASYSPPHCYVIPPVARPHTQYFEPHRVLVFDAPHPRVVLLRISCTGPHYSVPPVHVSPCVMYRIG
ncbi:hypothetical protein EDD15DRAFT_761522 [Pisolithus albus]|nr:hypothetical protein EDD15DRAFT_761522 [Pisolithus albus]